MHRVNNPHLRLWFLRKLLLVRARQRVRTRRRRKRLRLRMAVTRVRRVTSRTSIAEPASARESTVAAGTELRATAGRKQQKRHAEHSQEPGGNATAATSYSTPPSLRGAVLGNISTGN